MNIAFFSSDDTFKILSEELKKHGIISRVLITEEPKPSGRGLKIRPNDAHLNAQKSKIPVVLFNKSSSNLIKKAIKRESIRLGFAFSFGKKIPDTIIKLFPLGIINLHPSLLPKYRGPTPIQSAIIANDKTTGFSIIKINQAIDAGEILYQGKVGVGESEDYLSLKNKILKQASSELPGLIKKYLQNKLLGKRQDEKKASFTKRVQKSDGEITAQDKAQGAYNKIRAYASWPKAFLTVSGKRLIIHRAKLDNGKLLIKVIQPEGKKPMSLDEFKRGYRNLLTDFPEFVKI